jgi:hypothetical protein
MNFFTLALDGGEWSTSRPGRFTAGPRAILDAVVIRNIPTTWRVSDSRTPFLNNTTELQFSSAESALFISANGYAILKQKYRKIRLEENLDEIQTYLLGKFLQYYKDTVKININYIL